MEKIEFSRELVEGIAEQALKNQFQKVKEKKEIRNFIKIIFQSKVKQSLDAIDTLSESPIEKQLGYALLAGFWTFNWNSIFVPPKEKTDKERIEIANKIGKTIDVIKEFEDIMKSSEFVLFVNNWVTDKIRTDFIVGDNSNGKAIIIECDSFQWHGNKEAFVKDKKRERELVKLGFPVLRYSGSEIMRNPMETAIEIISYLKLCQKKEC